MSGRNGASSDYSGGEPSAGATSSSAASSRRSSSLCCSSRPSASSRRASSTSSRRPRPAAPGRARRPDRRHRRALLRARSAGAGPGRATSMPARRPPARGRREGDRPRHHLRRPSTPGADAALAARSARTWSLAADDVTTPLDQAPRSPGRSARAFHRCRRVPGLASVASRRRRLSAPHAARCRTAFAGRSCWAPGGTASRRRRGALIQYFGPPRTYPTVVLLPGPRPGALPAQGLLQGQDRAGRARACRPRRRPTRGADTFPTPYSWPRARSRRASRSRPRSSTTSATVSSSAGAAPAHGAARSRRRLPRRRVLRPRRHVLADRCRGRSCAAFVIGAWVALRYRPRLAPPALPAAAALGVRRPIRPRLCRASGTCAGPCRRPSRTISRRTSSAARPRPEPP